MNIAGLDRVGACQVADTLDQLGFRHQVMAAAITPIQPGLRALGPAATLSFEPSEEYDPADPYGATIDFIDALQPGSVVVVATSEWEGTAFWGELFSAAAMGRGAVGMVTDGCSRDTAKVRELGFAVFARGQKPVDFKGRQVVVTSNATIRCAGVDVSPGDWVMADDDGIVVIPEARAEQALELAAQRVRGETTVREELLGGDTIREVWERHGIL